MVNTLKEIHIFNINWTFSVKSYALKATVVSGYSEKLFQFIQQKSTVLLKYILSDFFSCISRLHNFAVKVTEFHCFLNYSRIWNDNWIYYS